MVESVGHRQCDNDSLKEEGEEKATLEQVQEVRL